MRILLVANSALPACQQEMINKLDVDGSGEIEFDEFKAILT